MMKLLIISDDFTGALDTGIQFAKYGANTKIITTASDEDYFFIKDDVEVLVIDAETRHLSKEQAYSRIYRLAQSAISAGVSHIYKKTDSGLRGNIGSELKALLDAGNANFLPFIPAYPEMNRVTIDGIHYIDGQPISESVFGRDPFEPVASSRVGDLFDNDSTNVVFLNRKKEYRTEFDIPTIGVFDAQSDEDIKNISQYLNRMGQLQIMAGCAGFASFLPELLSFKVKKAGLPQINQSLLVVCGSINPISKEQIEYAQRKGFKRIILTPGQQLEDNFLRTAEGNSWLEELEGSFETNRVVMLDTGLSDLGAVKEYIAVKQMERSDARVRIASTLGIIVKRICDLNQKHVLMIIGGDTLMGFFNQIHCNEVYPVCEMEAGIVLSYIMYNDEKLWIISKSGGFGRQDVIGTIAGKLNAED